MAIIQQFSIACKYPEIYENKQPNFVCPYSIVGAYTVMKCKQKLSIYSLLTC